MIRGRIKDVESEEIRIGILYRYSIKKRSARIGFGATECFEFIIEFIIRKGVKNTRSAASGNHTKECSRDRGMCG